MKVEIPRCPYCKSTEVTRDASAVWSSVDQQWEIHTAYVNYRCHTCGKILNYLEWFTPDETVLSF